MAGEHAVDLVCLGEAMVEFDQRQPGIWHQGIGGDTLNVAAAAKAAGARVAFAGGLGNDAWGDSILAFCQQSGINTDAVTRDATRDTGLYFVEHDAAGHHFSYRRKGSAATRYQPPFELAEILGRARVLHYSGITLAVSRGNRGRIADVVAQARSLGVQVSFDVNFRPLLWEPRAARAAVLEAMAQCEILLPGMEDLSKLFGISDLDSAVEFCLAQGPDILVIKNGKDEVLLVDDNGRHSVTPPKVEARDANGAGDCFDGVFLANYLGGASPLDAVTTASISAANSTLQAGATR